jgi:hypothetical protein
MNTRATLIGSALALLLLPACDDAGPSAPLAEGVTATTAASGQAPTMQAALDLSGEWAWTESNRIMLRPPAVALFSGLAVEGPITTLMCHSTGGLTLSQGGSGLAGSMNQTSTCRTRTTPSFDPYPTFPHSLQIIGGEVQGRSIAFTLSTGPDSFDCHYRGAIRVTDGVATEIHATGSCDVPSELGTEKITEWKAVRQ